MRLNQIAVVASLLFATQVQAQVATGGTVVLVQATGEVTHANDEVTVSFSVSETGPDKAALASRVNRKMRTGTEIVRGHDASAKLKSVNYNTFAIYRKAKGGDDSEQRDVIGWRVVQSLEVTTKNLAGLPGLVAAAQGTFGVDGINFHLSEAVSSKLDDQRIVATYQNLNQRIASIAGAMGRKVSDAMLEMVDFDGAGNAARQQMVTVSGRRSRMEVNQVVEPSFEPGETTLQMQLVGKVKFK